ncbi:hypothetical protein CBR_g2728 [Chara braunii]|uniref:Uncharacterized protein n=1 Tax=Chara braunii TaxID=69332 RepID=A0A388KDP8_CHABU|nr:hypothetical protein CBR_g2728 [Chara braunii]|eukprot:GBG68175.1 hypothetical protein CBR_g2728 [Chara braunii]
MVAYVMAGRAMFAAAAGAHAGSLCWCSCCAPAFPLMVRRRQGARQSDGPASSRRQTIGWSGVAEAPNHRMVRRRQGAVPSRRPAHQLLDDAVVVDVVVGGASFAAPADACAGSLPFLRWSRAVKAPHQQMVRRLQGVRPLDGPASSRRRAIEASDIPAARRCCSRCCRDVQVSVDVVAVRDAVVVDVVVGGAALAAAAVVNVGYLCVCCSCAPAFPPMVRRRQGARPSDGPASSRFQTIGWFGVVKAPDHRMVRRHQGARPSDGPVNTDVFLVRDAAVVDVVVKASDHSGFRHSSCCRCCIALLLWHVSKGSCPAAHVVAAVADAFAPMSVSLAVVPLMLGPSAGSLPLLALPMARRRQNARPPDGPASSRRQTIRWYAIVEPQDHQMVRRCRGARPSDGPASSRRQTMLRRYSVVPTREQKRAPLHEE